jgi:SpoVK/Ycf46/Vps4 family AAA+-type ATPase
MADSLDDVSDDFRAQGCKIEQIPIPRPGSSDSRLKFLFPLLDPGGAMSETRVGRMVESRRWLEDYDPQAGEGYLQSLSRFASDTSGLTLIGIEDLLQQASQSQEGRLKREQVVQLKRDRLQQESGGMVEVVDPHRTLDDIGGYKHLKDRIREIVHDLRSPSKLSAQTIPMGVLFLGPPGTGKSIVAEALAGESGLNMVKLGDFRGKYVGESERNLSRVFSVLESLHPVIVFIDEIDQALGRRGAEAGDGGVDRRIFGRFLEFMSDTTHRGRILWIGAANLPGNIDSAFKRPGRFDLILAFTRPDSTSRADIIKKILEGKLRDVEEVAVRLSGDDYSSLAQKTPDYTGAELEAIVAEVLRRLARASSGSATARVVDRVLIERVLADYRPPARSRLEYQQMEDMALKEISFWDQLSKEIRDKTGTESSGKNEGS